MTDRSEVHPDLVGPPGDRLNLEQRILPDGDLLPHAISRGRLAAVRDHCHLLAVLRVTSDWRRDRPFARRGHSAYECQVGLADIAVLQLALKRPLRPVVLGDYH